jgi:hypothetical protein
MEYLVIAIIIWLSFSWKVLLSSVVFHPDHDNLPWITLGRVHTSSYGSRCQLGLQILSLSAYWGQWPLGFRTVKNIGQYSDAYSNKTQIVRNWKKDRQLEIKERRHEHLLTWGRCWVSHMLVRKLKLKHIL